MAAVTQFTVDALLGALNTAIKDEASLIGGVPGDLVFIKDEMDSMNGFLLYLTKAEGVLHDDQVRAWMKQVREIAYLSEDCVARYTRDVAPYYGGPRRLLCIDYTTTALFLFRTPVYCELHKLAKQIAELKVRVRDVGERRQRYDVSLPAVAAAGRPDAKQQAVKPPAAAQAEEERRDKFRCALLQVETEQKLLQATNWPATPTSLEDRKIWRVLQQKKEKEKSPPPGEHEPAPEPEERIRCVLEKCISPPKGEDDKEKEEEDAAKALRCMRMLLCALFVYPYDDDQEFERLESKLKEEAALAVDAKREHVMLFCYSMLATQWKSCLQYLTAFLHETAISRTSMVRRWVAEGLVGKEQQLLQAAAADAATGSSTAEEAGERCFSELVLRGFVAPARLGDDGTVRSCVMEEPITGFIRSITKSENFALELPPHLHRQLKIREIVRQVRRPMLALPQQEHQEVLRRRRRRTMSSVRRCCNNPCGGSRPEEEDDQVEEAANKDPVDELVRFLKQLPELYRLNVLDLGGCKGLEKKKKKQQQQHFFGLVDEMVYWVEKHRHRRHYFFKSLAEEVDWLKYLSLRDTDVSHLPADQINKLKLLETLDIRGTRIPPNDTKAIFLPKLKHLLAGRRRPITADKEEDEEEEELVAVAMPDRIDSMKNMVTLSHVQVSKKGTELDGVVRLRSSEQLRKLGVVVYGNDTTAAHLGRVLIALAGCLRSLSVSVRVAGSGSGAGALDMSSSSVLPLVSSDTSILALENLDIKGKIRGIPPWIWRAEKLHNVTLRDTQVSREDALRRLGRAPSLRCLKLGGEAFTDPELIFAKDSYVADHFKALKFLVVEGSDAIATMKFGADAAPKLEKIVWTDIGGRAGGSRTTTGSHDRKDLISISGIDKLPLLEVIELRGNFKLQKLLDWKKAAPTTAPGPDDHKPWYHCKYIRPSGDIIEFSKTDTTLTLPVDAINHNHK